MKDYFTGALMTILILSGCSPIGQPVVTTESYKTVVPTQVTVDNIPIGNLDGSFICKVSPDIIELDTLQSGNTNPLVKNKPKKSWQLKDNYIGGTTTRLPRSREFDFTPGSAIHAIDNDPETFWVCNTGETSEIKPWVRVQFSRETLIDSIELLPVQASNTFEREKELEAHNIHPRAPGAGFPKRIKVQTARNGVHWQTVYQSDSDIALENSWPLKIAFEPHKALDLRVIATELAGPPIWNPGVYSIQCFALAEIRVFDSKNNNIALASRGTNVFVSATEYGYCLSRTVHNQLWPMHYDVGYKYLRIAYWDSVLNWHYVEQEKGVYRIDPLTDGLVTEMVQNGIEPILCLSYSNWLYTSEGRRPNPRTQYQVLYEMAPAQYDIGSPMLEAYKKFVKFMVHHFKDRVTHFEIWNEPDVWGGGMTPAMYAGMVKEVAPIIRKEAPHAHVALGSVGGQWMPWTDEKGRDRGSHIRIRYDYLKEVLSHGVAPLVDTIGWHPLYGTLPDDPFYRNYPREVKELTAYAENLGFKGSYMATEFAYWARPEVPGQHWEGMGGSVTKLLKAKYAARVLAMHAGMGITAFWNETIEFAFRPTSNGGLQGPYQPEPIYYVIRTLCNAFDGIEPASIPLKLTPREPSAARVVDGAPYYEVLAGEDAQPIVHYAFSLADGSSMIAIWYDGIGSDDFSPITVDCTIAAKGRSATAIDIINGVTQQLEIEKQGKHLRIKNLKIPDYPVLVKVIP